MKPQNKFSEIILKNKALVCVFLSCFIYWTYLIFNSQMTVMFDSLDYLRLGKMIFENGWIEYFKTGPNREPLYPLFIAISLDLSNALHIDYQTILKFLQISMIFISQILIYIILARMEVRKVIRNIVILYFGFSPAVLNAGLSLFSEIAVFPFVLCLVLSLSYSWMAIKEKSLGIVILGAIFSAASFLAVSFGKAIFLYVFMFFLFIFICQAVYLFWDKQIKRAGNTIIYVLVIFILFEVPVVSFKLMNKKYNGNYEFTSRSYELLYANASKRVSKESSNKIATCLASIPGKGFCERFFSEEDCRYCDFQQADFIRGGELPALLRGMAEKDVPRETNKLTLRKIRTNPGQYLFFTVLEGFKMFFWESTQIGFVEYPDFISNLYKNKLFKDLLRLIISILTMLSCLFVVIFMLRRTKQLFCSNKNGGRDVLIYFTGLIAFIFTALYSMFSIVTRYALPIASLYLITIAFFIETRMKDDKR